MSWNGNGFAIPSDLLVSFAVFDQESGKGENQKLLGSIGNFFDTDLGDNNATSLTYSVGSSN